MSLHTKKSMKYKGGQKCYKTENSYQNGSNKTFPINNYFKCKKKIKHPKDIVLWWFLKIIKVKKKKKIIEE